MIYLASPYSHLDAIVREQRFLAACQAAGQLMRSGQRVFSPIAHSHAIVQHGVPADWAYWEAFDGHMLSRCDELVVLMLEGWRESEGVQAEIDLALELDYPIRYLDPMTHECIHIDCATRRR